MAELITTLASLGFGGAAALKDIKDINVSKVIKSLCKPRDANGRFMAGNPSIGNAAKNIFKNLNPKNFIQGGLNPENLKRIGTLSQKDALEAIGDFFGGMDNLVDALQKLNSGEYDIKDFLGARALNGLEESILKASVLKTIIEDGVAVRKVVQKDYSKIMGVFVDPLKDAYDIYRLAEQFQDKNTIRDRLVENINDNIKFSFGNMIPSYELK